MQSLYQGGGRMTALAAILLFWALPVLADDGRKERWNLTMHPVGKPDWSKLGLSERARLIREHHNRIRNLGG